MGKKNGIRGRRNSRPDARMLKNNWTYQNKAHGPGRGAMFASLFQGLRFYLLHVKEDNQ
jgi:hypothetical protein